MLPQPATDYQPTPLQQPMPPPAAAVMATLAACADCQHPCAATATAAALKHDVLLLPLPPLLHCRSHRCATKAMAVLPLCYQSRGCAVADTAISCHCSCRQQCCTDLRCDCAAAAAATANANATVLPLPLPLLLRCNRCAATVACTAAAAAAAAAAVQLPPTPLR